jgi:hypothetical protein
MALQFVTPNLWMLSGGGITIRYSTIPLLGPAGGPHLYYQNSLTLTSLTFDKTGIRDVSVPDLGEIVSVTLQLTIDTGSTTLSLLLPFVNILQIGPVSSVLVSTDAIITTHSGPFGPPLGQGQKEHYTIIPLTGTASHVLAE